MPDCSAWFANCRCAAVSGLEAIADGCMPPGPGRVLVLLAGVGNKALAGMANRKIENRMAADLE